MKTYSELKQFIEKTGCDFQCNPIVKEYEYFNPFAIESPIVKSSFVMGYRFGINNPTKRLGQASYQWYWFESIGEELNDDTKFYFEYRFSMINGESHKGWQERAKINDRIEKVLA